MTSPGAAWTAPLAWSPDARSFVVASGNPFRPARARGIDLASERRIDLGGDVAGAGAVAFNADGGFVLVASARRARAAGLLPGATGLLLAPWATRAAIGETLYRGTGIRAGESWSEGVPLDLGDVADWGEPTGVT